MSVKYIVRKEKDGVWSRPLRKRYAMRRCRSILRDRGKVFQIRRKGGESDWSRGRTLADTMDRLKVLLEKAPIGDQFAVRGVMAEDPVNIRKIDVWPQPADTPGTPPVDQFVAILNERWPTWRNGGIAVCKYSSPGVWSDHAYAAAIDVFDSNSHMEAIRDFAIAHAAELKVRYVILYNKIWVRNSGWKSYSGNWHGHVHISFEHDNIRRACA